MHFKAVEWIAHVDTRGLPPPTRPSSPAVSDANGALIESVRNGDSGYDPVVEADQLEKILGLSRHDEDRDLEARRVMWGLVVTGMGEIISVGSIATPSNGNLKLTGSLVMCVSSPPVSRRRVDVLTWVWSCRFSGRARTRAQLGQDARVRPRYH